MKRYPAITALVIFAMGLAVGGLVGYWGTGVYLDYYPILAE